MNTNLGDGKMLQITGNFDKVATAAAMSAELDKVAKVFQIQRLKLLEIPTSEGALQTQARAGDDFTDQLEKLIDQNRGKEKIRHDVQAMMNNLKENIERTRVNIESGKAHYNILVATLKELESE